jgi:predicted Zn-dependent protease with MMP-like domain
MPITQGFGKEGVFLYHYEMNREEFEVLVAEGFDILPENIKQKVKNVALLVEDDVTPDTRKRSGIFPGQTLFGLYTGVPRTARGSGYGIGGTLPDSIIIFKNPIENAARGDKEKIKRIVHDTVWHEVAHHFGMNENDVRYLEKERGRGYQGQ